MNQAGEASSRVAGQPPLAGARPPTPPPQGLQPGSSGSRRRAEPDLTDRDIVIAEPHDSAMSFTSLRRLSELGGGRARTPRGRRGRDRGRRGPRLLRVGWLLVAGAVAGLAWVGWHTLSAGATVDGIRGGEVVSPTVLAGRDIAVKLRSGTASSAEVRLNGHEVPGVTVAGDTVRFRLPALVDGTYHLSITSARRPFGSVTTTRKFTVDGTPPAISFKALASPVDIGAPVVLTGRVDGATELKAPGATVTRDDGAVTLSFPYPPAGPVQITATDEAGNKAAAATVVPVRYPKTNAVHVSAANWADPAVKGEILRMVAEKKINAVELDLKDERGVIGYASAVPLAREIGAVQPAYDLKASIAELHRLKVRVIGRIVAFADPMLAHAAWAKGEKDWVLQTPAGQPLMSSYGGFTNYVRPEVRAYNLAIAEEAAKAGIDDVMWDYVRRPEGDPATMVVPGLKGLSSTAIADFLRQGQELLRPLGVYEGAAVFGISATRPQSIAQDIPLIAQHVDYVAPMLYPERWGRSEYNVADPQAQPYDIIFRSLADFQAEVAPTGRAVVPWLQDYNGRIAYGPSQVRAQMQAAHDRGISSWFFWNPHGSYSTDGYPAQP